MMASTLLFILPFILIYAILAIYAERKISAFIQDRLGPMEVGYYGILQTVADLLKLIQKEDIVPEKADKGLFKLAPIIIFVAVFTAFAVIPLSPTWAGAGINTGLYFILAILSLDVIGMLLAGWSSNNKYSVMGTFRAAAQLVSYEVPLALAVLCVAIYAQSIDLQEIVFQQTHYSPDTNYLLGISALGIETNSWGGIFTWNVFRFPLLFLAWIVFFIASLAECNRAPFDLPEAESEIVAGFQTEYSGFRWAVIMLAEYALMLLVSLLGSILFFGGWYTPLPNLGNFALAEWTSGPIWGIGWLISKALFFVGVQIWIRWTLPRLRVDQLMDLGWKYLTPFAILLVFIAGIWKLLMV
jgi:NADH-quinone oxidoreductase subunit H